MKIKSGGLSLHQRLVVAWQYLASDRDDAVSVVVIQEVRKGLFPDQKLRVRSVDLAGSLRERERNLGQAGQARVFGGTFCDANH